mgnify:CR=1 FL=1
MLLKSLSKPWTQTEIAVNFFLKRNVGIKYLLLKYLLIVQGLAEEVLDQKSPLFGNLANLLKVL